jgi:hypothetical protein
MSAEKLSRLAGLVFVLAAVVGGAGATAFGAEQGAGGSGVVVTDAGTAAVLTPSSTGTISRTFEIGWE